MFKAIVTSSKMMLLRKHIAINQLNEFKIKQSLYIIHCSTHFTKVKKNTKPINLVYLLTSTSLLTRKENFHKNWKVAKFNRSLFNHREDLWVRIWQKHIDPSILEVSSNTNERYQYKINTL